MPKRVDTEERRAALVAAVLSEVEERGIDALTVRSVAARAGVTAGLVHHYFPGGKQELLHASVSSAVRRGEQRMLGVLDEQVGLAAVRAVAIELLPLTAQRRAEWAVWATMWSQLLVSPDLLAEQRDRLQAWRALLGTLLGQAVRHGELPPGLDPVRTALQLAAFLDGLGLHALADPDLLSPDVLVVELDAHLGALA